MDRRIDGTDSAPDKCTGTGSTRAGLSNTRDNPPNAQSPQNETGQTARSLWHTLFRGGLSEMNDGFAQSGASLEDKRLPLVLSHQAPMTL